MRQVFKNANVVDVIDGVILEEHSVIAEDGMITEITRTCPEGEENVVDLNNKYLMPGFFNCHIHLTLGAEPDLATPHTMVEHTWMGVEHLAMHIRSGVTFVRDCGSHDSIAIELRRLVQSGRIRMAPDIQAAGECICMTGGGNWDLMGYEADGADACKKAVREMIKKGANLVKLMATGTMHAPGLELGGPEFNEDELSAAITEAHKLGAKACAHAIGTTGIKNAVKAGIDSIEHGCFLDDEAIGLMLEHGTYLLPTLAALYSPELYGPNPVTEEEMNDLPLVRQILANLKKAYQAGVCFALGTDCGTPYNPHSSSAFDLIAYVEKCGFCSWDALRAGTINGAKCCGVEEYLGSITVGKKAHMAVFDGNPIQDIHALENCVMTIKNGQVIWEKI